MTQPRGAGITGASVSIMEVFYMDSRLQHITDNQIIRKDARNCFVESLSDAFGIGKVHLAFSTYDLSRPAGQRQTANIHIYIAIDEFLELCRKLTSGELRYLLQNKKLSHLAQRTTRAKILSYLSEMAQQNRSFEFDIPYSRQQLADYLSVERSGLSVELGKMRRDGLLNFHKNHFVLLK